MKKSKKSEYLPFEIDEVVDSSMITAHAGVPMISEVFRASGCAKAMDEAVRFKERERGLSSSQMAESLFSLWSAGGERCEDFNKFRNDPALCTMLGFQLPASNTVRDFLESFHEETLPLWSGDKSSVPMESEGLRGLSGVNGRLVKWSQVRKAEKTATLDVDASIYESHKSLSKVTYDGVRGYQPVVVLWSEKDLIIHDEFRDGNVPAHSGNERIIRSAIESLPAGVEKIYVRGDSALYEHGVLRCLDEETDGYAISAKMTVELKSAIEKVEESEWRLIEEHADAVREWAEVLFTPDDGDHRKTGPVARRYLAIRIRKKQGNLFADGSEKKHFAVVTNLDWEGEEIISWHRKKAGTVEHTHDVMKNGLAAGAFPSGKFGVNAAWFRLSVICHNLLSVLKRTALPGEFQTAKPKKLRFEIFNVVGKVVEHARKTFLRLSTEALKEFFIKIREMIHLNMPILAGD